ncbi:MAG: glycosyltransferase family 1 protein, partial [Leptospiraceae bacterium]|nr:glycosyltransferase family 1 protein [Leptospiraceae bacterium]
MLKKFHIGIDARPLSTPVSGVGRLIAETLIGFPEKEKFEFHFFSHRPLHFGHEKLLNLPNVTLHIGKGWIAKKGGFYFNFYLPFYMQKLKLHLFWGTQQVLPPFL